MNCVDRWQMILLVSKTCSMTMYQHFLLFTTPFVPGLSTFLFLFSVPSLVPCPSSSLFLVSVPSYSSSQFLMSLVPCLSSLCLITARSSSLSRSPYRVVSRFVSKLIALLPRWKGVILCLMGLCCCRTDWSGAGHVWALPPGGAVRCWRSDVAPASVAWQCAKPKMDEMPDLSHLTEEERRIIESVMMRQKEEEQMESEIMR